MNTQTKITWFAFMLALFWISYWLVCNSNAKASTEYFELEQRNIQLENEIKELQQQRWDYEDMKNECIESYTQQQNKVSKQADKKRIEQWNNEVKKEGLLKRSKPLKKTNMNESKSSMNDTQAETTDNWWFKKLLRWVESLWFN